MGGQRRRWNISICLESFLDLSKTKLLWEDITPQKKKCVNKGTTSGKWVIGRPGIESLVDRPVDKTTSWWYVFPRWRTTHHELPQFSCHCLLRVYKKFHAKTFGPQSDSLDWRVVLVTVAVTNQRRRYGGGGGSCGIKYEGRWQTELASSLQSDHFCCSIFN